jgi:hypothetical protein
MKSSLPARPISERATAVNFCSIFDEYMDNLYSLAFLLTADHDMAEVCFVTGLENCLNGSTVFKEWAHSWSKRAVIKNAIRLMNPLPGNGSKVHSMTSGMAGKSGSAILDSLTRQSPFDRFVYVMSVLERYTDQECSVLLSCSSRDVVDARSRVLHSLARARMRSSETVEQIKPKMIAEVEDVCA